MGRRALVACGTRFGSAEERAEGVGSVLVLPGFDADVRRARNVRGLDTCDIVVLGSGVYAGRWLGEARRLLHREELRTCEVRLFSSGPVCAPVQVGDGQKRTRSGSVVRHGKQIRAHEHGVFGGAISDSEGGALRRRMAKSIAPAGRGSSDWNAISAWAEEIAAHGEEQHSVDLWEGR